MLIEADQQVLEATGGECATHAIVPVGVGSIAQAVTMHFKSALRERTNTQSTVVMSVEPTTAVSFKTSLEAGEMTIVPTEDTIMCGMNCGTVSTTAWPILKRGVDVSIAVTDHQAHTAVIDLARNGIKAGPCGAATLAALRVACACACGSDLDIGLNRNAIVVLYCTEGSRDYAVPN
jgi:diaminopropionate ammonia-lyase